MNADVPLTHQDALALKASLARLESCLDLALENPSPHAINALGTAHDIVVDLFEWQTTHPMLGIHAQLERIARFITYCAGHLYQDGHTEQLDEAQRRHFITRHARSLLSLDGVGPATAQQLFRHGVFEAEQVYALNPDHIDQLTSNNAIRSRLKALSLTDRQAGN